MKYFEIKREDGTRVRIAENLMPHLEKVHPWIFPASERNVVDGKDFRWGTFHDKISDPSSVFRKKPKK